MPSKGKKTTMPNKSMVIALIVSVSKTRWSRVINGGLYRRIPSK